MTSFSFRNNILDLIRLIAALQVVVVHSNNHLKLNIDESFMSLLERFPGVPIFFVVSGFLISASYERSNSLFQYYQNRVLRIFPGLWFCFVISLVTILIFSSVEFELIASLKWGVAQLTMAQFYNPDFLRTYGVGVVNGSLWTIPVELQFYIILPVIYWFFRFSSKSLYFAGSLIVFLLFIALSLVFFEFKANNETLLVKLVGVTVFPYLYMFLVGVFLQRRINVIEKYLYGKFYFWLALYLISSYLLGLFNFTVQGNYLNPISAILLSLLTISAAYSFPKSYSTLLKGNDISYGVYIYHMLVINIFVEQNLSGSLIYLAITLACTIALASFSWLMIEKKALSFKHYSLRKTIDTSHTKLESS